MDLRLWRFERYKDDPNTEIRLCLLENRVPSRCAGCWSLTGKWYGFSNFHKVPSVWAYKFGVPVLTSMLAAWRKAFNFANCLCGDFYCISFAATYFLFTTFSFLLDKWRFLNLRNQFYTPTGFSLALKVHFGIHYLLYLLLHRVFRTQNPFQLYLSEYYVNRDLVL